MTYQLWDLNRDGAVDIFDLVIVGNNFGKSGAADVTGDVNGDGSVNIYDLVLVGSHFGERGVLLDVADTNRPTVTAVSPINFNTQVEDLGGSHSNFFRSLFDTAAGDTTPPEVVMATPNSGATDIGHNATIVLTFSEPLNASTINRNNFRLLGNGQQLFTSVVRSSDNRTVILGATLPAASVITVIATGDVQDLSGNPLADFRSEFATAVGFDAGRPSVVSQRPGNGANNLPLDTRVVWYINEPLDKATIPGTLLVSQNGVLMSGITTVTEDGREIEFSPTFIVVNMMIDTSLGLD